MIAGVVLHALRQIPDERGRVMHMLRRDDPWFVAFGEIYFSVVYPGAVKAWHLHKAMTLNYAVVSGRAKLVLYDDREGSPTRGQLNEIDLSPVDNYQLVTIPPLVWNGFKGMASPETIVANCATVPHQPDEIVRVDPFDNPIPFDWGARPRPG